MPEPWASQYQTQFEKEFYMAVNVFRNEPVRITTFIKELKNMDFGEVTIKQDALISVINSV